MLLPVVFISRFLEAIRSINCLYKLIYRNGCICTWVVIIWKPTSIDQFWLPLKSGFVRVPHNSFGGFSLTFDEDVGCKEEGQDGVHGGPFISEDRFSATGSGLPLQAITTGHNRITGSQATNMIMRWWECDMIKLRRQPTDAIASLQSQGFAAEFLSPKSQTLDWKRRRCGRVGWREVLVIGKGNFAWFFRLMVRKTFWFCWSSHDD